MELIAANGKKYDMWIAQWESPQSSVSCGIWQKNSTGSIDGITENVDVNIAYKDYPTIIKNKGLNGFGSGSAPTLMPTYKTYTVVKRDSLWAIAQKQLSDGTKWKQIYDLNGLKSDVIYPGQVLKIPD